jgi:hypothetical protein
MVKPERRFRPDAENPQSGDPMTDIDVPPDQVIIAWRGTVPSPLQPSDPLRLLR